MEYNYKLAEITKSTEEKIYALSLLYIDKDSILRQNNWFSNRIEEFTMSLSNMLFMYDMSKIAVKKLIATTQESTDCNSIVHEMLGTVQETNESIRQYFLEIENFFKDLECLA